MVFCVMKDFINKNYIIRLYKYFICKDGKNIFFVIMSYFYNIVYQEWKIIIIRDGY